MQRPAGAPFKFSMGHKSIKYQVIVNKAFHDTPSFRLTMSGIPESNTILVSDLDEVRYHKNAQENAT